MISNPLVVALGAVLYEQRLQFAKEKNIGKGEAMYFIADRCAVADSTLREIESGNKAPSVSVANRLIKSGIYKLDYSRMMLVIGVLEELGDAVSKWERYVEKCHSIISLNPDDDICDIVENSKSVEFDKCHSNEHIKRQIVKNGVFEKMEKYLSHRDHLPKRRIVYCADFAKKEELSYIWETEKKLFPGTSIPLEYFEKFWDFNNQIFTIVYKDETKQEAVGHFKLYPLPEHQVMKIIKSEFKPSTGTNQTKPEESTVRSFKDAVGLWIGVSADSDSKFSCGSIILEMLEHIKLLISNNKISFLFTYARTDEGIRLMERFGFREIPGSDVSMLTLTEDNLKKLGISKMLSYS